MEAKTVLTAEDRTKAAFASANSNLSTLTERARVAASTLAGLGAAATVGGLVAMAKAVVDDIDAMNDLRDATGATIENISALDSIARRNGASFDTVSGSLVKFNQVLSQTSKPGSEAEQILKKLGLSAKELRAQDPAEALRLTAVELNKFAENGAKARAVQELFGKSIREAAPFLKDVAEAGQLNASITTQQAEEAERFNKQLFAMQGEMKDLKREIVTGVVPAMTQLLKNYREIKEAAAMDVILKDAAKDFFSFGTVKNMTGDHASDINNAIERRTKLERQLSSAMADGRGMHIRTLKEEITGENRLIEVLQIKQRNQILANTTANVGDAQSRRLAAKALLDETRGSGKASDYENFMKPIKERLALAQEQLTMGRQLTEQERFYAKTLADVDAKGTKWNATQKQQAKADLETLKILELKVAVQKSELEQAQDIARERQRLTNEGYEQARQLESVNKGLLDTGKRTLDQLEFEISLMGMSNQEREVAVAMRELETAGIKRGTPAWEAYADAIAKATEKRSQLQTQADFFKGAFESVDRTAHDVFTNIFDSGSNVFKKLGQTAKATLLDVFYQLTARPWLIQVAGSAMGAPQSAIQQAIGPAGGGMGGLGALGQLGGLLGGGGGFGTAMGATLQNGLIGGFGANMANIGTLFSGGSYMGALGAAAPYLLPVLAIGSLLKGAFKGETRSGGQYNMGQLIAGPSGGEIGQAGQASKVTADTINAMLKAVGSSSFLTNLFTGVESSEKGKGFAYAGGTLSNGAAFGQGWGAGFDTPGYMNRRGSMTPEQATAAFTSELKQATLQAMQVAADIPATFAKKLQGLKIDELADSEIDAYLNEINAVTAGVGQLRAAAALLPPEFERFRNLTFDAAAGIIELSGGIEGLVGNLNSFYANYYSKDEQRLNTANFIKSSLDSVGGGVSLQQILGGTRKQYREFTESFAKREDEAGKKYYLMLLSLNDEFAAITPEMENAADASASYSQSLKDQASLLQDTVDKFDGFADSLKRFMHDLTMGPLAQLSPEERYRRAGAEFDRLSAMPANNEERLASLEAAGREFLEASQAYNASNMAYFVDLQKVKGSVEASEISARATADVARLQLGVLQSQLSVLSTIAANTAPAGASQTMGGAGSGGATFGAGGGSAAAGDPNMVLTSGGIPFDLAAWSVANANNPQMVAQTLQAYGKSQAWIAERTGQSVEAVNAFFDSANVPRFAAGGSHRGGWRMVGEHGPELEATGAARIFNSSQTRQILSQSDPQVTRNSAETNTLLRRVIELLEANVRVDAAGFQQITSSMDNSAAQLRDATLLAKVAATPS